MKKNLLLKDFFVEANKFKYKDGKYNTKVGVVHLRKKPQDTDEEDFILDSPEYHENVAQECSER